MNDTLREVAPGVRVADAKQRFVGLEVGTRMTVLELSAGTLVHSPIAQRPDSVEARWVLAPNLFHHLYVGAWSEAEAWGAAGLGKKRKDVQFAGEIVDANHPFGDEVWVHPIQCFSFTNEVVVLHRPSRTLIVSDLVFNLPPTSPWLTRFAMWLMRGYPGPRVTLLEKWGMKREAARADLTTILEQDFDRVIMAHGDIIESGGKEALRNAFAWLF